MGHHYDLEDDYEEALSPLRQCNNISSNLIDDLLLVLYKLHRQKRFSEPMPTIGMYIALASLCCLLAMVADIIHGMKYRKSWYPCKYFTLNAVSLTVIAVAVKLPMDLTNPMPGDIDQQTKLGSVAFMCIMMTFLLPSLATMNRKDLVTNIIALGLLVITLVVNICIQINTGLVSYSEDMRIKEDNMGGHKIKSMAIYSYANRITAITYVAMLLMLMMIYICSALMILKSKQDLESKYQAAHERALLVQQQAGQLTVENLKQRVINYGIMAGTGSPQLMTVCSATSSASAVICVSIYWLHYTKTVNYLGNESKHIAYDSDYKWSILVIYYIQYIGITLGAAVMLSRFLTPLTNMSSTEGIWKLIKFYEVESCWTHTLSDWKHNRLYSSSSPNFKIVFYKLQILGLTLLTLSQKAIVITCKAIRIIPVLISMFFLCYYACLFLLLELFGIQMPRQSEPTRNIHQYVLQLQDDMELPDEALYFIIKSVERSIQNAEKQQPSKLMKLLVNFRDFEGVKKFDSLLVQPSPGLDYPNCWSLPVVTLATIAVSLHKIQPNTLKNFLNEVTEGLVYVKLVEESLNNKDELVSVQKAAERLWLEVEVYNKWLGNYLQDPDFRVKTAIQIVEWFNEKATNMVTEVGSIGICACSMRRITETILLSYHTNIDELSQEELFTELSSMIADILAACLTNLPQVIVTKCHESAIEKREESVYAAATLLGKTSEIINTLKDRVPESLINNPGELPFIDKWRDHLTAPAP
ncbi:hypothetical protein CTI12_AA449360 [Artemisia annua]|uniref:Uncharacterized protein n=1 Tax=Artemisia annua TaxID=35608 RepID=A0A2U1LVM2_ARTAN|nr:hypothetical protein CTI12_AA449360 [Artemisia annua]